MSSMIDATATMTAGRAWVSSSVNSTMVSPFVALRAKRLWQGVEQNQRRERGRVLSWGSKKPKPAAGRMQTAHSTKRGCQSRRRSEVDVVFVMAHATRSGSGVARPTSPRISRLLKRKVISAEA
jgi:hypothetical protein